MRIPITVCQSAKEKMGEYCLSVMQEEAVVQLLREEGVEIEEGVQ